MGYTPHVDHRRSIRLPSWDYRENGAYFITICAYERKCMFEGGRFTAPIGEIWRQIPAHFPGVEVDELVVMPNHVHGIILIARPTVGAHHDAPLRMSVPRRPILHRGSLGAVLLQFKSAAAKRINELRGTPGAPVWQRNYYERVLRDESRIGPSKRVHPR